MYSEWNYPRFLSPWLPRMLSIAKKKEKIITEKGKVISYTIDFRFSPYHQHLKVNFGNEID